MSPQTNYIIGLDFGTESARGVLIDAVSGSQIDSHSHAYRHGVMTATLPGGELLLPSWALQDAADYLEAASEILGRLGRSRNVESIGIGFTASTPMPIDARGEPLSRQYPGEPHAYVKLWKHAAAQRYADEINARGGSFLDNFGGKVSGEWLLPKAAQLAQESPDFWAKTARFIEAGDWLVLQLTGVERRSLGFAAYKAQYMPDSGYPVGVVDGIETRLAEPAPAGTAAGELTKEWRARTGIAGRAVVAVAIIDSHVVLPAVGGVSDGTLVAALGTSAVYLYLSDIFRPLPKGIEGVARDGSISGLWCYEAGQAGFGDTLSWFVRNFPTAESEAESFKELGERAGRLRLGEAGLVALDWWSGNRVPWADSRLSGVLAGLVIQTTPAKIYRAIIESICFGARSIVQSFEAGGLPIERVVLTSGLASKNPLLLQIMADVLGRTVLLPQIDNATSTGAAIHGAVAAKLVSSFAEGHKKYGAAGFVEIEANSGDVGTYSKLFEIYQTLSNNEVLRRALVSLHDIVAKPSEEMVSGS